MFSSPNSNPNFLKGHWRWLSTRNCTVWPFFYVSYECFSLVLKDLNFSFRGAVAWWLTPRTPDREVGGSSPTRVAVFCPWATHIYPPPPPKVLVIPRKRAPSQHGWKIVYRDVKQQTKQNKQKTFHLYWLMVFILYFCLREYDSHPSRYMR